MNGRGAGYQNWQELDPILVPTPCVQCGNTIQLAVQTRLRESDEPIDGKTIVQVEFMSIELVGGCEHVEEVRERYVFRGTA